MDDETRDIYSRANKLTDAILQRLGEMHLKATLQPPTQGGLFTTQVNPRGEIFETVVCFLGEEMEDGEE